MSCTQNGISMCEGHRSFALMPAIVACDNRHANMDLRPLTREQIAAIPGVKFPAIKVAVAPAESKTGRKKAPADERASMVALYQHGVIVEVIAKHHGRHPTGVRDILIRAGVYTPKYTRRMKKKEAA